jgi:hypothetical protein
VLNQEYERNIDRMDAWVILLDKDVESSEQQFKQSLTAHLINIDTLIDIQDNRLLALETEFDNDLNIIETMFGAESEEINRRYDHFFLM